MYQIDRTKCECARILYVNKYRIRPNLKIPEDTSHEMMRVFNTEKSGSSIIVAQQLISVKICTIAYLS